MTNKLTAAERIKILEKLVDDLNNSVDELAALNNTNVQNIQTLASQNDGLREIISALAKRLNATIDAGETGNISNDSVNATLVQQNIKDLKDRINLLKQQQVLEDPKAEEIHERSFVVGREVDKEGNELNPRIQFAVASLTSEGKEKIKDKKLGDIVKEFSGDDSSLEITELYDIAEEKPQSKNFEEEPAEVEETVEEAKE